MNSGKQAQAVDRERLQVSAQAAAEQLSKIGQQLNATNADFLKVDVETALTFTQMALDTDNQEKRDRNRGNARKAYDTISRLRERVVLTPAQEKHLNKQMQRLTRELTELGEKF